MILSDLIGSSVTIVNPNIEYRKKWLGSVGIIRSVGLAGLLHDTVFYSVMFKDGLIVNFQQHELTVNIG